jgi:hypothetical protein
MHDLVSVRGIIEVMEQDASSGEILTHYRGPNRVTDAGLSLIADRIRGNTGISGVTQYALGSSSTPPTAGDTALLAELFRNVLTQTRVTGAELKVTLFLGSTEGNGFTFREGGAFNEQNTLLCRGVFPDKVKSSSKTLTVIHTIPLTAS